MRRLQFTLGAVLVYPHRVRNGSIARIYVVNFSSEIGGKPDLWSCRFGPLRTLAESLLPSRWYMHQALAAKDRFPPHSCRLPAIFHLSFDNQVANRIPGPLHFICQTQVPLDFHAAASVSVVMENDDTELARMIFAELTGALEDASVIASEGQSPHTTSDVVARVIRRLDSNLANVEELLRRLKALNT